jgi:hypothetical protein
MLKVEVEDGYQKYFLTGKSHLKMLVMINHHLVSFIQHDPGEL